jgi:hypothetical protein
MLFQRHERGIHALSPAPGPAPRPRRPGPGAPPWARSDNLAAASLVLSDDERAQLDQVSALPLIYPYWHQAKTARDRLSPADLTLLGPYLG